MSTRRMRRRPSAGGRPAGFEAARLGAFALVTAGLLVAGPLTSAPASVRAQTAQGCPQAVVVVPAGAGSGTDLLAREIVAAANRAGAKPPLTIRNIDGNGGIDGAEAVLQAAPDGCTMLFTHQGLLANFLSWKAPFAWHEFRHGALLTRTPMVLVASTDAGFDDVAAMLEAAGADSVSLAVGDGDISAFALREMADAAGVDFDFLTVSSARDRVNRLLDGTVDVIMVPTALARRLLETGKVILLAVTDAEPSRRLPGLDTLEAQGVAFSHATELGILLPPDTPLEKTREIVEIFEKAMDDQILETALDGYDIRADFRAMTAYTVYWENLMAVWRELAVEAGYRRASR